MWVQALDVAGKSEQEEWDTDEHCCSDIKSALCTILMFEKKPLSAWNEYMFWGWFFCLLCTLDQWHSQTLFSFLPYDLQIWAAEWTLNTYLAT